MSQQSVRSIFISDVHLGTSACQASLLLDFLESTRCETLYLVGDIIDLLAMRKRVQFTSDHQAIIAQVFKMTQSGTRVVYIPGNHDALFWRFHGQEISGVEIKRNIDYTSLDGRTFLVSHGDEFDTVMQCSPWLNWLGDVSHELLLKLNTVVNTIRRSWGRPYWSIARAIKKRIGSAQAFINRFETLVARRAAENNYYGFICGHIHHWQMAYHDNALYLNDGDWVEHCSALVETHQGEFQLWHCAETVEVLLRERLIEKPCSDIQPSFA